MPLHPHEREIVIGLRVIDQFTRVAMNLSDNGKIVLVQNIQNLGMGGSVGVVIATSCFRFGRDNE